MQMLWAVICVIKTTIITGNCISSCIVEGRHCCETEGVMYCSPIAKFPDNPECSDLSTASRISFANCDLHFDYEATITLIPHLQELIFEKDCDKCLDYAQFSKIKLLGGHLCGKLLI